MEKTNNNKEQENRDLVHWKVMDIINQVSEIEKVVAELDLTPNDDIFLSNIYSIKTNIEFFFSNWNRGLEKK